MTTYTPRAGSKVSEAISLLSEGSMSHADLSAALEVDSKSLGPRLQVAIENGAVLKTMVDGRVTYSAPASSSPHRPPSQNDGDGKPVRRSVANASIAPSAEALACANPFGHNGEPPPPDRLPIHIPRFTRLPGMDRQDSPATSSSSRFGIFSDGSLVIEHADQSMTLDAAATASLLDYLSRIST